MTIPPKEWEKIELVRLRPRRRQYLQGAAWVGRMAVAFAAGFLMPRRFVKGGADASASGHLCAG